jgi:hypothetical protein
MSVSSEVQRTLVKSPPELWAELSDPATLARHLGELGEIRIVRTEPDRAVDWEAAAADGARASGRVEIEPSGWGTRVTLSASRVVAEPAPEPGPEAQTEPEPEAQTEPEPEAQTEPAPEPERDPKPVAIEAVPEASEVELEPGPEVVEHKAPSGFFARLFRRRKNRTSTEPALSVEPEPPVEAEPPFEPEPPVETEPPFEAEPEPIAEVEIAEPAPAEAATEPDISAELAELEEQTTAVLTGVLDRLGAAHHRPFSRS